MSHDKMTVGSYKDFLNKMIRLGHTSVLEHINLTFSITCDIAVSRELIRHRHIAVTEASTRYCIDNELVFIDWSDVAGSGSDLLTNEDGLYEDCLEEIQQNRSLGMSKDRARRSAPLGTATYLTVTTNLREWAHIIKMRDSEYADYGIRWIAQQIKDEIVEALPWIDMEGLLK